MHSEYKCHSIQLLRDQQTRFAPREKKLQQMENAERLLRELVPERVYSYEFVCYRVTGYRPDSTEIVTITGEDLRHDLLCFVEDLSESANITAVEVGQPVHTVEQLSKMFNVSTKTISRWRQQGLVSRKIIFDGGRKRVGFLHSTVDRFVKENQERVKRGERFSQLTDNDREDIIERARRLARAGGCPAEVTRRIANHMNRSVETIRYTIKQFDEKNPDLAVFPSQTRPLNLEIKERIYADFLSGKSMDAIVRRYCRTRSTVYRVINEMRAAAIADLPLEFMDNPEFHRRNAEARILAPMPEPEHTPRKIKAPSGLPQYLASLYDTPLLTRDQEAHLFRKFNFLKFRASRLRDQLDPQRPKASEMDKIEALYAEIVKTKNQIVQANLRLVVSIAKRHLTPNDDFFQLVSDGNMSLIRAVEKFDYSRGNKFSTYASWAIMKNYARTIPQEFKQRDRFRPTSEEVFLATEDERTNMFMDESAQRKRLAQVGKILNRLDEREQAIIVSRFGLDYNEEPLTLKEVGEKLGVTKERIRQIEARALNKLRAAAKEENIEIPE
ncbi:MAG TPA: sigma-70 family RNA polymerase sigma factor [Pirellulaceae bacterium]|nr:sigma-70 family RNA polymerase sigma factor [Pirellulaceae bacterium]HMO92323.1 sigma-70 family RNA polymerase sigma factor [Pirellulaceae bacterium]HMP69247.1 sigma-70 family RNA polymerase sigma factor [Pirellulaceae bacterium]